LRKRVAEGPSGEGATRLFGSNGGKGASINFFRHKGGRGEGDMWSRKRKRELHKRYRDVSIASRSGEVRKAFGAFLERKNRDSRDTGHGEGL